MTNDPNWRLPVVPYFRLASPDFAEGGPLPEWAHSRYWGESGKDRSPALEWSGAPAETQSFVVTTYDPDAPSGSGWWHWVVANLPAATTSLAAGAGDPGTATLPDGAVTLPNESREASYFGAAPPTGTGEHRYFFTVSALNVPRIDVDTTGTPALLGVMIREHVIARAQLVGVASAREL